jgi:hypothetical protein
MSFLESCFVTSHYAPSNIPLEEGLKNSQIDVELVSKTDGTIIRFTNLWQLYAHAFSEGYATCLYDIASGDVSVKMLDTGEVEISHHVENRTPKHKTKLEN